ncbi:MAG: hypothetical protein K9J13_13125, partial [Saprospiraceae bacterium]|nr:hypothetical protein [Saprospiraceae bacterium]
MKGFNLKLLGLIILLVFSLQNNLFSQTYPTSYGNIATFDHITNVSFAGINNSSGGTSGYYNYTTGTHASLTKGQSYNLDVTIAFDGPEYVKVWIDWNGDKDFADAGEEYVVADAVTNSGPHTVSISVPMGASTGTTRMRVSLSEFTAPTSNGIWMFGEVEDYSVDITAVVGQSDMLYYVSNTDDNLYSIDRTNGDCALLGATGKNNIEAIAMWPFPSDRKLYAVDAGDFGYLNKSTGAFTLIGEVDGGGTANGANGPQSLNDVDGLAFDPLTGKLWATERKSGTGVNDLLFQINPATGLFVSNAFGAGIDYFSINSGSVYYDLDDISFNSSGNL